MEKLEDVLKNFDRRLAEIERRLQITPAPAPQSPAPAPRPSPMPAPKIVTAQRETPVESGTGSLFGIVGIVFLLLAAVFFLKLTIDSGWLTPERQVALAAFFGLACLLVPHFLARLADDYGALLSGAGAAVLHVTWLGAYQVHHLLEPEGAMIAATGVGVLSILLNARLGNAVFVVIAVAGTYLSAPLIGYNTGDFSTLSNFFLIWNVSFSALGFFVKRRDVLLVASWFAVVTVGLLSLAHQPLDADLAKAFLKLQGLQFAVFALAMLGFSVLLGKPLKEDESWGVCLLLLLFYAHAYSLASVLAPEIAPWMGVALSLAVLAIYRLAAGAMQVRLESTGALTGFAALVLLHSLYFKLTPDPWKPGVALALALFLAAGYRRGLGPVWKMPAVVALAAIGYGALLTFSTQFSRELTLAYHFSYGAVSLVIAGALLSTLTGKRAAADPQSTGTLLLGFGHVEMLCGLYQVSRNVAMSGSLFVSVTWGLYALAILLWGWARKDRVVGQSAILILAAVSLKAAFYDVLLTSSLSRVLSLLAAGLLLYVCGWVYRQMQTWTR
jgi:uncharacterized membrane protein